MPKVSAGILLYRREPTGTYVLLVHPGGPFWQHRDIGAWSIPKGEYQPGEDAEASARREFEEELGSPAVGAAESLGRVRQNSGKWVEVFALEGDFDVTSIRSNTFEMVWPPRTGQLQAFPEVDRAAWFSVSDARLKLLAGQVPFLDRLEAMPWPPVGIKAKPRM